MLSFPIKLFSSPSIKEGYKSRPLLCWIFLFFPLATTQELPSSDISNLLNMSLATNNSFEEDEKMLVLRHTELYINFSYNNIFSLLYKFLVMQVHRKNHRRQWKMSSSEKLPCKGTLRQVFICKRPRTPYPPLTHWIRVFSILYLFTQRRGGGESTTREKGRVATVHKAGSKIPTWLTVSPVHKHG